MPNETNISPEFVSSLQPVYTMRIWRGCSLLSFLTLMHAVLIEFVPAGKYNFVPRQHVLPAGLQFL